MVGRVAIFDYQSRSTYRKIRSKDEKSRVFFLPEFFGKSVNNNGHLKYSIQNEPKNCPYPLRKKALVII
jgi:hypothetical protein